MHKSKNYLDLIYNLHIRYMIAYQDLKIRLNIIDNLYMRYMISCQDLNFTYIYQIYAYMLNL